jgi:protein-disulfide isomerase
MANLKPPVSEEDHIQGSFKAPVILVEYGDFQCPHCGAAHPIIKEIEKYFGKQLAFVFRHFPLSESHPFARLAAVSSEAAGNQGKFWEMHDLIYQNQAMLGPRAFTILAEKIKLDLKIFQQDIKEHSLSDKVESNFESGILSGVNGTPTFYINGVQHYGTYEYQVLADAISHSLGHLKPRG